MPLDQAINRARENNSSLQVFPSKIACGATEKFRRFIHRRVTKTGIMQGVFSH
jgi:hypothetical protein